MTSPNCSAYTGSEFVPIAVWQVASAGFVTIHADSTVGGPIVRFSKEVLLGMVPIEI